MNEDTDILFKIVIIAKIDGGIYSFMIFACANGRKQDGDIKFTDVKTGQFTKTHLMDFGTSRM